MQTTDIYDLIARQLCVSSDPQALLGSVLEPIVRASGARAGSAHLRQRGAGRLQQTHALSLWGRGAGEERTDVLPLGYRDRVLGRIHLTVAADAVHGEATLSLHRTVGALLGLALHDAGLDDDSREALAADLHDGIAQTLSFARMRLPLLEAAIGAGDGQAALRYCAEVSRSIGTAHTTLRAILAQTGAPMDPRGLKHALQSSVRCFREQTAVDLVFNDTAPDLSLTPAQEAQLCLIVQEALANIAKHASARHAWLEIRRQDDLLHVVVEDDGAGLPAPGRLASPSHFGIDIMRQRAARLGGEFQIAAREGGGTRMRVVIPCGADVNADTGVSA